MTATFAFTVPLLPSPVRVQVKTQAEPSVPALTMMLVRPHLVPARGETVTATGVGFEIEPSLTVMLGRSGPVELHHAVFGGSDCGDSGGEGDRRGGAEVDGRVPALLIDGRQGPVGACGGAARR